MRILIRPVRVAAAAAFFCFATAAEAGASSIPVTNFSFEAPDVSDGAVSASVPGWAVSGALVFDPTATSLPAGTTDGGQVLFLQAIASASQTLGDVLTANTTYDLRVDVGSRADFNFADGYEVALLAGSTVLGTDSSPVPSPGSFVLAQVLYTANAGDPMLGQALSIRLRHLQNTSNTVLMDNVRLDATTSTAPPPTVPEPASMFLVGSGMALLASRRRR